MIKLFARFFRGLNMVMGITPIPGNASPALEKKFVFMWFGIVAMFLLWCSAIAYWFGS
jgi:hypothetical protein